MIDRVKDAPLRGETEIYNLKDCSGRTPIFVGDRKVQIVLLYSGLKNMELTRPDSTTLLWSFTREMYDTVSISIINTLRDQVNQRVTFQNQNHIHGLDAIANRTPVFGAEHERIVKVFLEAAKTLDIHLDTVMDDGYTLLHNCVRKNIVTPYILRELGHQRYMTYRGITPMLYATNYSKEAVELYIRFMAIETSEKINLYDHCLGKSMLSRIIANKLCPALSSKNTRKLASKRLI